MEIERKFLLKEVPSTLDLTDKHHISQGYIDTDPVVRIRRLDNDFILTIKSRGLVERIEIEKPLSEKEYNELSTMVKGNLIDKDRYKIPLEDGLILELDIFHGSLEGLILAEIEFNDIEKAGTYKAPGYLTYEVSTKPEFQNSSLSSMSIEETKEFMLTIDSMFNSK